MSAAQKLKPQDAEEMTIEQIALEECGGDMVAAVELLTSRICAEPRIVGPEQVKQWARSWAYARVHSIVAAKRKNALSPVPSVGNFTKALKAAANAELTRMMETPLFGGKRIADATVDEVRESARRYEMLADDTARKSRWQNMVADAAEKKKAPTIGEALTEKVLVRLWDKSDV